jgi:phage-related protein
MKPSKRVEAIFFKTASGNEPVREWLRALPQEERKIIGDAVRRVEFSWPVGMPWCRSMGSGLHEVRSTFPNRIARILFCVDGQRMVLLHGFIKKDQRTSKADLDLALERKRMRGAEK